MSALLMGQVWAIGGLSHVQRDVLLALADHAHDDGTSSRPGVAYIAWKTEWTTRAVQKALRVLEELGLIVPGTLAGGRSQPTEYLLRLENGSPKTPLKGERRDTSPPLKGEREDTKGRTSASRVKKNHQEPPREPTRARARDPLFDALAIACGFELASMTKESARLCGIAKSEIAAAGGTPEMMEAAVRAYRKLYDGAAVTPKAIANHWPAIAPRARPPAAVCPECELGGGQHLAECSRADVRG